MYGEGVIINMRVTQLHVRDGRSVREFAYQEDKNSSYRQDMEDYYLAEDQIINAHSGLFAVFDGHGGNEVAAYCATNLPKVIFREEYGKQEGSMQQLLTSICRRIDAQVANINSSETGSTCCLVFVRKLEGKRTCHIANLGDTRAVLCSEKLIGRRVTIDHKVTNPSEVDRIRSEGGTIIKGRVGGQLAITRALGDLDLKPYGVSNVPDYEEFEVDERTLYLIVASDGLWDVCEDQQAIELTKECEDSKQIAKTLLSYALANGSRDNTSVLVLKF